MFSSTDLNHAFCGPCAALEQFALQQHIPGSGMFSISVSYSDQVFPDLHLLP